MSGTDNQAGELFAQPYGNDEWAKVAVELTEKQITVKMRDLIQEDTLATHVIVNKKIITLKREKSRLGIYIQGGLDYKSPVKINRIIPKSPASKYEIAPLDIILKVNGISLWGKTHAEASKIVRECGDEVTVEVGKLAEREDEVPVDPLWIMIAIVPIDRASITKYKSGTCTLRPCTFEIMSRDGEQKVTLKCEDEGECANWIRLISEYIQKTIELKIEQYNNNTPNDEKEKQIIKMSWVSEHMPANLHTKVWCRKALFLKKTSLLLYEIMPDAMEEHERPETQFNLTEMTLKVLPPHSYKNQRPNTLFIVSGTGYQHTISCETESDLSLWTALIHKATIATVTSIKQCHYAGIWENMNISLVLDIDEGILLLHESQILWQKPFKLICKSSDDAQSKLQITFYTSTRREGKETFTIELENLQLAICGLDCFVTTKVAQVDPQFIEEKMDILAGRAQPRQ